MFELLYVRSAADIARGNIPPFVTIFFGQHPVGFAPDGSGGMEVEGGCGLTLSQSSSGDVLALCRPFSTGSTDEHRVLDVYSCPSQITETVLEHLVQRLFSYAQVTSVWGHPNRMDRRRVFLMKMNHCRLTKGFSSYALEVVRFIGAEFFKKGVSGGA
jgi:hypothetical protein